MACVADVLRGKGDQVHTIAPDATVRDAIDAMCRHGIGALVVIDGDHLAGIFTERDFMTRVALSERDPRTTGVREVMTRALVTVEPRRELGECMRLMTRARIRHLPVVREGRLAGMISIGDVTKHASEMSEFEARQLRDYIHGSHS